MKTYRIFSSHLALRFYRSEGWTEELVKNLLKKGRLRFWDEAMAYWVAEVGSVFDTDKVLEAATEIYDFHQKLLQGDEAREYVNSMSWGRSV